MRIAVMADIHGNILAFDAVLTDIECNGGADEYLILGDIVALGPAPIEVLERLSMLSNVRCIRGNTDRYVCTGDRPSPSFEDVNRDPTLLHVLVEVAGSFAWTQGAVTQAGWFEWLSSLPVEVTTILPDGTRALGAHAAPGRDDGLGLHPGLHQDDLLYVLGDCDADLIFGGHHHQTLDVNVNGKHIVNVGSVSNPFPPDLRASYVMLEATSSGYHLEHRRVAYDRDAVVEAVKRYRHPGAEYIQQHMHGIRKPSDAESIQRHLRELRKLSPEKPET
jgi:predicted phosphodiesterase